MFTGQAPPSGFAVVNNLLAASKQFQDQICPIPTKHNQIATRTTKVIDAFLVRKCREGSPSAKGLSKDMDRAMFVHRLIKCHPHIFINSDDTTTTCVFVDLYGSTAISKSAENRPALLPLSGYLTYDEGEPGTFGRFGIYLAVVGSRFEVHEEMESRAMNGTMERPPLTTPSSSRNGSVFMTLKARAAM
ncbi:hypothetical protein GGF31_000363 [Allomyces arbusculus]|nr:hypothetical protein GGF31_000363 [Allomyces arbusculus]